jgi:hypothetical protein
MADDPQLNDGESPDLGQLVNAVGVLLSDGYNVGGKMGWLLDNAVSFVTALIGVLMRGATRIATVVATGLSKVLEEDNPELGRLAASILGGLFGHSFAATIPGGILNPGNLDDNAEAVGAAVLQSVFGGLQLEGGATLEPGLERAESYLGTIANLVTRGFILDLVEEMVPHWHLEVIHNLEHELLSGLGLGRIARTVLRPIVTTLVADPAQWALNLSYRPTLLPDAVAIRQWLVGAWGDAELDDELGRKGFSADRIDALVNAHKKHLSAADLFTLVEHKILDEAAALDHISADGYDDQTRDLLWQAMAAKRREGLTERAANTWLRKYEEGLIDHDTFVRSLSTLNLPDDVAALYALVGGAARETPQRVLSLGDMRQAWTKNLVTQGEFHDYMIRLGYSDEDATTLVLLELATLRDRTEAEQEKKRVQAERAAQLVQEKAAAAAKRVADAAAAQQERQRKAAAAAAQKAKIAADELALKTFAADAAAQKTALVNAQRAQGLITDDTATLAQAQIAADLQELLANVAGQQAASRAAFERQILELRQADREATIAQQLDDVSIALLEDRAMRQAAIAGRVAAVDELLARKLADLDDLTRARRQAIDDDLADALAALQASTLPTAAERQAHADQAIAEIELTLTRKLADIATEYADRRAANDQNLADGLVKQTPHDLEATRLDLAQLQAERMAQQAHDLSVTRFQEVARHDDALAIATADKQQAALQAAAAKARTALATDTLKQTLAARQAADAEHLTLQTLAAQIEPITQAEAARRRRAIGVASASAQRAEAITETEIAKGEADAQAAMQKAAATVQAAKTRMTQLRAAAGAREGAQAAASAAQEALAASLDRQRLALEAQLSADQAAGSPGG